MLPLSHDEVVHGKRSLLSKMPGDAWQQLANLRLLYGFMYGHPGKKLLFMGAELAQWEEWGSPTLNCTGTCSTTRAITASIAGSAISTNSIAAAQPCTAPMRLPLVLSGLTGSDAAQSIAAFVRRTEGGKPLIFVVQFYPRPSERTTGSGLPAAGPYREVLNSDAEIYGGSGVGHGGWVHTEKVACHGRPHSARLRLPPLGVLILEPK